MVQSLADVTKEEGPRFVSYFSDREGLLELSSDTKVSRAEPVLKPFL